MTLVMRPPWLQLTKKFVRLISMDGWVQWVQNVFSRASSHKSRRRGAMWSVFPKSRRKQIRRVYEFVASSCSDDLAREFEEKCGGLSAKDKNGCTVAMIAAKEGRCDIVRCLVGECGADVNAKDDEGKTALMMAAESGHFGVVRFLAHTCGANVNIKDKYGYTALTRASDNGYFSVALYLARKCGAKVNTKGKNGYTALMTAATKGRLGVVQCLVGECGADMNFIHSEGCTALMIAAEKGHADVVRYLAGVFGANVDEEDKSGFTALTRASDNGHFHVVRYLARRCGADVNMKGEGGYTALMRAAEKGCFRAVRRLVQECDADVNAKSDHGKTALMIAAAKGHFEMVKYLAGKCITSAGYSVPTKSADEDHFCVIQNIVKEWSGGVNAKDELGITPLMMAAETGHLGMVRYLAQECGANLNAEDKHAYTALTKASDNGHFNVVMYLAGKCGADVNVKGESGFTALMRAADVGRIDVVRYLVRKCGAEVNMKREGHSALMLAAKKGHFAVVRYLARDCRAEVDTKHWDGYTALMLAAENGHFDIVQLLASKCDANVNAKDKQGLTVLMMAAHGGHFEMVRYLAEDCGANVNATNNNGHSAAQYAANRGDQVMLQFLIRLAKNPETDIKPLSVASVDMLLIPPSELAFMKLLGNANGFGGEYLAKWLDADVAVKRFVSDSKHSSFGDSIRAWQQLRHPNIIKLYGACDVSDVVGLQLFVYEYASGGSLLQLVELTHRDDEDRMTWRWLYHLYNEKYRWIWKHLHEAALGLEYLHERKIIHGDLRCSNILIGSDGLSKLSNFGLGGSGNVGPKQWVAPEVLKGEAQTFASDVYSLGMCVLEATTGKTPWSDHDIWNRCNKLLLEPESTKGSWYSPKCPVGDAQILVWRLCCKDPRKRMSLSSVVSELGRVAGKGAFKYECNLASMTLDTYRNGQVQQTWSSITKHMKSCRNDQYCNAFEDLKRLHEYIENAPHPITLLAQFHILLTEFNKAISMTPDQALAMRLSATSATTTGVVTFYRRMESLWGSLGESIEKTKERHQRWDEQQRDAFMSGVSDLYLHLNKLKSDEERQALITKLNTEAENHRSKYTPDQVEVMKKTVGAIKSKLEGESSIPEWFIPWYELVVDELNCLGAGGFGCVYRGRWLDSDVAVKRLDVDEQMSKTSKWSLLTSMKLSSSAPFSRCARDTKTRAKDLMTFRHEVDLWFTFRYPHVIQLFGACHVGKPFFVCEYATNGTLVSYLEKHPDELWVKLHEAALGVQYLHARNVAHGDLKGNNILVGSDMKAKVTDFGLSTLTSDHDRAGISGASHWVAPECFEAGARPTYESDIYSLGMCIVEAIRVVEAANGGKDKLFCLPWGKLDNVEVRALAKRGTLPLRPGICTNEHWDLICHMCASNPLKRMRISAVVDKLASFAGRQIIEIPSQPTFSAKTLSFEAIPVVISSAFSMLRDASNTICECQLFIKLWDRLEWVHSQNGCCNSHEYRDRFCSLVADTDEATRNLLLTPQNLKSDPTKAMRCYELNRRLDKFLDASQLQ